MNWCKNQLGDLQPPHPKGAQPPSLVKYEFIHFLWYVIYNSLESVQMGFLQWLPDYYSILDAVTGLLQWMWVVQVIRKEGTILDFCLSYVSLQVYNNGVYNNNVTLGRCIHSLLVSIHWYYILTILHLESKLAIVMINNIAWSCFILPWMVP